MRRYTLRSTRRAARALALGMLLLACFAATDARAAEFDYPAVYDAAAGSVVYIVAFVDDSSGKQGSGFFVTENGRVLTNRHVIWNDVENKPLERIFVFLKPATVSGNDEKDLARRYAATVVAHDAALDLALLELKGFDKSARPLRFAPPESLKVGRATAAIGHPRGGTRWSLTTGRISGIMENQGGIEGRRMIQMETALNPGNSGGPLLNSAGQVLGINTAVLRKDDGGVVIEGINFALASDKALNWLGEKAKVQPPEQAKTAKPLSRPKAQKAKKTEPVKSGTVFTEKELEREMDEMLDDMEKEIDSRREMFR